VDEENAFLASLRASPADDTTRLVYADWLDERGDRRGEFLRVAVAARTAPSDAELHRHLDWAAEERCSVQGACFVAPLAADGNEYRVEVKDGWWAVLEVTRLWIS
jgi:uncharacterized protein (TIGR02996 family)